MTQNNAAFSDKANGIYFGFYKLKCNPAESMPDCIC